MGKAATRVVGKRHDRHPDGVSRERVRDVGKLDWASVASRFNVISARDLLAMDRMRRYQDIRDEVCWLGASEPPLTLLFISHRWETLAHPDPAGRQHRAIQELLRRVCTCAEAMLVPRGERLRLVPSLEQEGWLQAEEILRRALGFGPFSDSEACVGGEEARKILEDRFAVRMADQGAFREWLAGMVGVWVDYTCMPQQPLARDEDAEFRQTLRDLDALVASSTVVALRHADDDYTVRGWCAAEFFLGSARSFSRGLFVDIGRLANAEPVAIPRSPRTGPDALAAKVMTESYTNDLAAWREAVDQWSTFEGPLIREYPPDPWGRYRDLQGSAFSASNEDPNPFRRVLDAITKLETSLVENWLMSERDRTFDLGKEVDHFMRQEGLHCAKDWDMSYLGFIVSCHGWIDAFKPLLRESLRRYVETVDASRRDKVGTVPALCVGLKPAGESVRALLSSVRPASAATWCSRLRSAGRGGSGHEASVVAQVRAAIEQNPLVFLFPDR